MGAVGTARARTPRVTGGRPVRLGAAALIVLTAGVVVAGCGSSVPTPPRTARVERASVSTSVSAVGSVSSSQVNVGFPQGGQLTSVRVAVGDRVTRGQVLATVDSYAARQALRQAEAQRDAQQASLEQAEDSTSVGGAATSGARRYRSTGWRAGRCTGWC